MEDFMEKLSKITQKVGETASETYKTVADKSSKLIEDTKIKMNISENEEKIKKIYSDIGRAIYNLYLDSENVGAFEKDCKKIDRLSSEISELNKKLLFNKDLRKCSNCGEVIPVSSMYCKNCGQKQKAVRLKKEKEPVKEHNKTGEVEKLCPQCDNICELDSKFCLKCGYKF